MNPESTKRILMIDNTLDAPLRPSKGLSYDFREFFNGVSTEVRRAPERDLPKNLDNFSHVILSGSRCSILDNSPWVQDLSALIKNAADASIPMIGVCYGHQIIAKTFGAKVGKSKTPEVGWVEVQQTQPNPLFDGVKEKFYAYQSHFEEVVELPRQFQVTAENDRCAIQAYKVEGSPIFGVQFHPEKNLQDGLRGIASNRGKDCIFNESRASSLATDLLAKAIFANFLKVLKG